MKVPYQEGSIFTIPLRTGGYGIGVIARASKKNSGGLLGYFFGPKREDIPSFDDVSHLKPSEAIRIVVFGDLHLLDQKWQVIGSIAPWDRQDWPMPYFVRKDDISKKAWRVRLSETNVHEVIEEQPVSYDSPLERQGLYGAGAVELLLTKLLS
jgi:hypothetical protein